MDLVMYVSEGSSVVTNMPLWWGMLMVGEVVHVWGQGVHETSLYCLFNFAVDLKVL